MIAPDLLGHGQSDKPRADYSVGGYANGMRDLLTVLGIDRVTVVGHSLGGGVAMQFAYQYPERTERMVLVAPGGLGPEVTPMIRAVSLPGSQPFLGLAALPGVRPALTAALRRASRTERRGRGTSTRSPTSWTTSTRARPDGRCGTSSVPAWTCGARSSRWSTGPTWPRSCRCGDLGQ